jgi:twitching motility two-component system response regulator PilH
MSEETRRSGPLVAIVDDEVDVTTFLGLALEDAGFSVVTTNEPANALPLLRRHRPDLICLDLLMPEKMGTSLFVEIRRDRLLAPVPIVILSGLNARDEIDQMLADRQGLSPPTDYLEKPPEPETLIGLIRRILDGSTAGRQGGAN